MIELDDLTNRFKELKSLVYDYKDKKEDETKKLTNDINYLQDQINDLNKNYDQLISNTAKQIEDFVEKVNLNN